MPTGPSLLAPEACAVQCRETHVCGQAGLSAPAAPVTWAVLGFCGDEPGPAHVEGRSSHARGKAAGASCSGRKVLARQPPWLCIVIGRLTAATGHGALVSPGTCLRQDLWARWSMAEVPAPYPARWGPPARQGLLQQPLYPVQIFLVGGHHQRNRLARPSGAARAANAVDVILGVRGQVEIEHMADRRHIQPPRGHIRRDQQAQLAIAKLSSVGCGRIGPDRHESAPRPSCA